MLKMLKRLYFSANEQGLKGYFCQSARLIGMAIAFVSSWPPHLLQLRDRDQEREREREREAQRERERERENVFAKTKIAVETNQA